jgi:hypothetical protein
MTFSPQEKHIIGQAWAKLVERLTAAEDEYRRLSQISGGRAAQRALPRMNQLAEQIESLKRRIEVAEKAMG